MALGVPKIPAAPTRLVGVDGVPNRPVGLTVGVTLDAPLGLASVEVTVELVVMVPVVPPREPLDTPEDAVVWKLPTPVLLEVEGAVKAFDVIEAAAGRLSAVDALAPPPPPVVVELDVALEDAAVTTPDAVTFALGGVT